MFLLLFSFVEKVDELTPCHSFDAMFSYEKCVLMGRYVVKGAETDMMAIISIDYRKGKFISGV